MVNGARAPRDSSTLLPVDSETRKAIEAYGPSRFTNRELSWLAFASRLVDLAEDDTLPTLERMKFLAILSQGLDEFFQVRIAGLKDQLASNNRLLSYDGLTPRGQLQQVKMVLDRLYARVTVAWRQLRKLLMSQGISIMEISEVDKDDKKYLREYFVTDIYPILTPLAIDPSHPFPYISNLSLNLAVRVKDDTDIRIARVKVPPLIPRFVPLPGENRFVLLEEVIATHIDLLFPNVVVGSTAFFRVTRNTDIILEEGEAEDLLALVETELRRRRFGRAVRLEVDEDVDPLVLELLVSELEIHPDDVYRQATPLGLDAMWSLYQLDLPDLKTPPPPLVTPPDLMDAMGEDRDLFAVMSERDILVHHPYESFSASVESFIAKAADDPDVLAIKQTLYRTSGDSTIVDSLVRAAEHGKQVAVLVEVKARFDELANISWARTLEEAGVHVVYGLVGLKTHLKAALVVRKEGDRLARYCHLGTGNYNARTAKTYEDFGLLTSNPEIGSDLTEVFNMLTGFSNPQSYAKVVLAPNVLRDYLTKLVRRETSKGPKGRIVIKVNGLVDPPMIDELYAASLAGVKVDLLVRGICTLRAGVTGLSENISVHSVVGSVLEHSRIYCFGGPSAAKTNVYLASADLMSRNLNRRVEALFPLEGAEIKGRVLDFLALELADDMRSWKLEPDASWIRLEAKRHINAQERLGELAMERFRLRIERR